MAATEIEPAVSCLSCRRMKAELDRRKASDLDDKERKLLEWVAKEIARIAETEKLGPNEQIAAPIAVQLLRLLAGGHR